MVRRPNLEHVRIHHILMIFENRFTGYWPVARSTPLLQNKPESFNRMNDISTVGTLCILGSTSLGLILN